MGKLKYIPQSQESECGLCCASIVLNYFGCKVLPKDIKEYEDIGRDGLSLQKVGDILASYNLNVDFYEVGINRLDEIIKNPIILYWNNNHFVVLYKIKNNNYYIIDPALGKIKLTQQEFSEKYSNFALTSTPNENFSKIKPKEKHNNWKLYIDYFLENKKRFILLFSISLIFSLSILLIPTFIGSFTSYYEKNQTISNEYTLSLLLIVPLLLALYYSRVSFMLHTVKRMDLNHYHKIVKKLFSVPFQFFLTRSSSLILFRLALLRSNRELIFDTIFKGILDSIVTIVLLIAVLMNDFISFVFLTTISLIFGLVLAVLRKDIVLKNKLELNEYTRLQSLEYETFSSIFSIKANSQEEYMGDLLMDTNKDALVSYVNRSKVNNIYSTIIYFLNTFGPMVLLVMTVLFSKNENLNIGLLIFIFSLSGVYFQNFSSLFNTFNTLGTLKNNLLRINDILDQKDEEEYVGQKEIQLIETIEFENVYFSFPGQKNYVLEDISFKIYEGEKIGFAGATGSGKSTILGLVLGIYKPTKGKIYINNQDIHKIDINEYKKKIGFVPQEPFVYNKSIKDNILMNREINDKQLIEALKVANLLEDISRMPLGMETVISESGTNISGGQKQRIIIARAIVDNPDLLILDEATSSLDNQTELSINKGLQNFTQTQIIVAHRLSSIKKCDKIIFLDIGIINDIGSYDYLKQSNPKFAAFSSQEG